MNLCCGKHLTSCFFNRLSFSSQRLLFSIESRFHPYLCFGRDFADFESAEPTRATKRKKEEEMSVPKSQLFSFLQFVKYDSLSPSEQLIHTKHLEALERDDDQYKDPVTGYLVFTRLAHLRRGECCGSACRHCPYGHKSVPADKPKKIYNSAFYL